jgi:hypothetical protein
MQTFDIQMKLVGHGYQMTVNLGPFEREPTDRQVINAREAADQMFNDTTGRPVVSGVAQVVKHAVASGSDNHAFDG